MPHAENGIMGENSVNGEAIHSQFLDVSYPNARLSIASNMR